MLRLPWGRPVLSSIVSLRTSQAAERSAAKDIQVRIKNEVSSMRPHFSPRVYHKALQMAQSPYTAKGIVILPQMRYNTFVCIADSFCIVW